MSELTHGEFDQRPEHRQKVDLTPPKAMTDHAQVAKALVMDMNLESISGVDRAIASVASALTQAHEALRARVAELERAMIQQAANSAQAVNGYVQQVEELRDLLATVVADRDALQAAVTAGIRHRQEYVERIDAMVEKLATVTADRDAARQKKNQCVIDLYRKLDEKDAKLASLTLTWTRERPTVAGGYWVRRTIGDDTYIEVMNVEELGCIGPYRKPLSECAGWEFAGPIPLPREA